MTNNADAAYSLSQSAAYSSQLSGGWASSLDLPSSDVASDVVTALLASRQASQILNWKVCRYLSVKHEVQILLENELLVCKLRERHFRFCKLCSKASNVEGTGNANVPVAPGMFVYDGWSCFNTLLNKEPPLAQAYSNPKKCRLTPEVGGSSMPL